MKGLDLRETRATLVDQEIMDDDFILEGKTNLPPWLKLPEIDISLNEIFSLIVRLFLCCLGVLILKQVETRNLNLLQTQKISAEQEYSQLEKQMQEIQNKVKGFEYLQDISQEFNNKLVIMEEVANKKLKVIKGLDQIQTVILKDIWLEKIDFRQNKFTLEGFAKNNSQVQDFIERLEKTELFVNVHLDRVSEVSSSRRKQFNMYATLR